MVFPIIKKYSENDDIYKFKETKKIEYPCEQLLKGVVIDKTTGFPLANSKVTLSDANYKMLNELTTDNEGKFNFGAVVCDSNYYIKAEKSEYSQKPPFRKFWHSRSCRLVGRGKSCPCPL